MFLSGFLNNRQAILRKNPAFYKFNGYMYHFGVLAMFFFKSTWSVAEGVCLCNPHVENFKKIFLKILKKGKREVKKK